MIKETSAPFVFVAIKRENFFKLAKVNSIPKPPMSRVIIGNQLAFPRIATFYQFLLHAMAT